MNVTHYSIDHKLAFILGACEVCGVQVQEPNAVHMSRHDAERLDLKDWEGDVPGEIEAHDDGSSHCGCRTADPVPGDQVAVEAKDGAYRMGRVTAIVKGWYEIDVDGETIKARRKQLGVIPAPAKEVRPSRDQRPGVVSRSHTGRKTIHNGDAIAFLLESKDLDFVYRESAKLLNVSMKSLRNAYSHLNLGQQRMCCGNRVRGAVKRGEISL